MHLDFAAGETVTMTVTVTPRTDEASRGFGSRPKVHAFASERIV
jgi:hypothetical protein